jgi:hypothetical protein
MRAVARADFDPAPPGLAPAGQIAPAYDFNNFDKVDSISVAQE